MYPKKLEGHISSNQKSRSTEGVPVSSAAVASLPPLDGNISSAAALTRGILRVEEDRSRKNGRTCQKSLE